ncbi:MAG: ATP:cob(I)alamin adenosyltransferase [Flavobacteriaceae bacterium]|nr:ATP:cob(I)alamin adenosyltransferase [Flavobacteriaceae bacterium]
MSKKVYTRKGDDGSTFLLDGQRVSKDHIRIEILGDLDELNSWLGFINSDGLGSLHTTFIIHLQKALFNMGASIACTNSQKADEFLKNWHALPEEMENEMDRLSESLNELQWFILPTGNTTISGIHVSRAICRRTERKIAQFAKEDNINPVIQVIINRLSDYLFVLARHIHFKMGVPETPWNSQ